MKLKAHRSFPSELQSLVVAGHARLSASHAVERLWARDHRLWKQDPTDITNRLGWLTIIEHMKDRTKELRTFATSAKKRGIHGPPYLHSTGQLHKGGPRSGLFLQLVDQMSPDLSVPGKPFTFRTLAQAQAAGDIQALQTHGHQAIVVPLGKNPIATIQALTKSLVPRTPARRPSMRHNRSGRARKK